MDLIYSPLFWQGVLASIIAGLILTVVGYVLRITSSSVREWWASRSGAEEVLRQQLASDQPTVRTEATLQILFGAAKWLIIAALLFLASMVVFSETLLALVSRIFALACLIVSLWWVFQYQNPVRAKPSDLSRLLISRRWVLVWNPPHQSKPITFLQDGTVGEGQNQNEHLWRVWNGKLELIQEDGRVHSRFAFNQRTTSFIHTNDPDTLSIKGQYVIPAASMMATNNGIASN